MSTHNLCFQQKYEQYQSFLSKNFKFLEVKFSVYLNRRVFRNGCAPALVKHWPIILGTLCLIEML